MKYYSHSLTEKQKRSKKHEYHVPRLTSQISHLTFHVSGYRVVSLCVSRLTSHVSLFFTAHVSRLMVWKFTNGMSDGDVQRAIYIMSSRRTCLTGFCIGRHQMLVRLTLVCGRERAPLNNRTSGTSVILDFFYGSDYGC